MSTTDSFITDTTLKGWLFDAHVWATSYKKWPFTEGRIGTTFASGGGPGSDEWFFEGIKSDSIRFITIGGKKLRKLNFQDYQIFREAEATGTDRVFSDFGRTLYVNPYADVSGTMYVYGQYQPYIDVTDETGGTVFTGYDEEGNEAIVEKMQNYLKRRQRLVNEAELHDKRAAAKLEEIWARVQDEAYAYETHPDRGGMFKPFDVLEGGLQSEVIKRNQFN